MIRRAVGGLLLLIILGMVNGERSLTRHKRGWTMPGTLWCGAGSSAENFTNLGIFNGVDLCCREHDHCYPQIQAFEFLYGIRNYRLHTVSHCDCDKRFRLCLHALNDTVSALVGTVFFNILEMPCFSMREEEQCVEWHWWGGCKRYDLVPKAEIQKQDAFNSTHPEYSHVPLSTSNRSTHTPAHHPLMNNHTAAPSIHKGEHTASTSVQQGKHTVSLSTYRGKYTTPSFIHRGKDTAIPSKSKSIPSSHRGAHTHANSSLPLGGTAKTKQRLMKKPHKGGPKKLARDSQGLRERDRPMHSKTDYRKSKKRENLNPKEMLRRGSPKLRQRVSQAKKHTMGVLQTEINTGPEKEETGDLQHVIGGNMEKQTARSSNKQVTLDQMHN